MSLDRAEDCRSEIHLAQCYSSQINFFSQSRFTTLSAQVASQQANQDASALLIDALVPVIVNKEALVIDYTSRQSEGQVSVVGYDPVRCRFLRQITHNQRKAGNLRRTGCERGLPGTEDGRSASMQRPVTNWRSSWLRINPFG